MNERSCRVTLPRQTKTKEVDFSFQSRRTTVPEVDFQLMRVEIGEIIAEIFVQEIRDDLFQDHRSRLHSKSICKGRSSLRGHMFEPRVGQPPRRRKRQMTRKREKCERVLIHPDLSSLEERTNVFRVKE